MHEGRIIFAQIMDDLPREVFDECVKKYRGNFNSKGFTCRDQFLAMAFAQLTLREGLRGIQETLKANEHCLYHTGFQCGAVARNTLAKANENRPWQIYAELALALMQRARKLYEKESLVVALDATMFALDSTTINLCLARFPWTPSQQSMAAVKMHVLLNLRSGIPEFVVISVAKKHNLHVFDYPEYSAGAYCIMERLQDRLTVLGHPNEMIFNVMDRVWSALVVRQTYVLRNGHYNRNYLLKLFRLKAKVWALNSLENQ